MLFPYRDDNPAHRFPVVTVGLIAVNVAAFLYSHLLSGHVEQTLVQYGAIPGRFTLRVDAPPGAPAAPVTLVTSMFLHGDIVHLVFNLWFLWIFGDNVEDVLGRVRYLLFYLLGGAAALFSHILTDPAGKIPLIGASGAVSAVMGVYLMRFPGAMVRTFVLFFFYPVFVRIPAIVYLGLWFLGQVVSAGSGGQIAWYAHIGGFLAGVLYWHFFGKARGKAARRARYRYY